MGVSVQVVRRRWTILYIPYSVVVIRAYPWRVEFGVAGRSQTEKRIASSYSSRLLLHTTKEFVFSESSPS